MITIEILKCNGCGANLSPDNIKCDYCGSEHIIKSNDHPLKVEQQQAKKIISYYKAKVKDDPSNGDAVYALGLFYLNLKNYDLAIKNFQIAIDLMPEESDVYYYYALSLIRGKRVKTISFKDIKQIEEYLRSAIQLEANAKYYYLAAIINYDFYSGNGMKIPTPDYNELIDNASSAEYEPDEIKILLNNVIIRDEKLISTIKRNT